MPETVRALLVVGDSVIVQPSRHNAIEPSACFAYRVVHSPSEFNAERTERSSHAFADAVAMNGKLVRPSSPAAHMGEAQEVERLGAFTASFSIFGREATELDQTGLGAMEFQPELGHAGLKFLQARGGLVIVLEPHHKVIGIADHNNVAGAPLSTPPLDPEVKDIVKVHVRQEG